MPLEIWRQIPYSVHVIFSAQLLGLISPEEATAGLKNTRTSLSRQEILRAAQEAVIGVALYANLPQERVDWFTDVFNNNPDLILPGLGEQ